jgi:hypothetical protein
VPQDPALNANCDKISEQSKILCSSFKTNIGNAFLKEVVKLIQSNSILYIKSTRPWLKQTSVKSNFQHVVYTIFFRRPQKKTLIFGIPSNFKYYSTELRTKHTLVAMVTTTVCNDFIAHRLEGI